MRVLACRVWRDDRFASTLCEPVAQSGGVVGAVRQKPGRGRYPVQKDFSSGQIVRMTGREREGQGSSRSIGYGMNLGRPSAARASDRLTEVPPFAPDAERWALMWVESMAAVVATTPLEPLSA